MYLDEFWGQVQCLPGLRPNAGEVEGAFFDRGLESGLEISKDERIYLRWFFLQTIFNHMVEYVSKMLDQTFAALADPTRRRIFAQLAKGDGCVTALAQPHAMSPAAVSNRLIVLEKAGSVKRQRNGGCIRWRWRRSQ